MRKIDKEKIYSLEEEINELEKKIEDLEEKQREISRDIHIAELKLSHEQGMMVREFIQNEVRKTFNKKFAESLMKKLIKSLAEEL